MAYNQPVESSKASMASDRFVLADAKLRKRRGKAPAAYARSRPIARKAPRKRVVAARMSGGAKALLRSPHCTTDYIHAITNPFDAPSGACLPADLFPLPTQKLKIWARGSCVLGTTGFGFISVIPTATSDAPAAWATSVTSVMAVSTALNAVTNTASIAFAQSPFLVADINTNKTVQTRLVALGLRLRYTGTEAGRNGIINCMESAEHLTVAGMSYDFIRTHPNTKTYRPAGDGSWTTLLYSGPAFTQEMTLFSQDPMTIMGTTTTTGTGVLVAAISGVAADKYEFEIFEHFEAMGINVSGKTRSDADAITYAKAQEAIKDVAGQNSLSLADTAHIIRNYVTKLAQSLPFLIESGSNIALALKGNPANLLRQITGAGMTYNANGRAKGGQLQLEL